MFIVLCLLVLVELLAPNAEVLFDFDRFLLYNTLGKKPNLCSSSDHFTSPQMNSPVNDSCCHSCKQGLALPLSALLLVILVGSSSFFLGMQFEAFRARRPQTSSLENTNTALAITNNVQDKVYQFSGKILELRSGAFVVQSDSLGKTLTVNVAGDTSYSKATILPTDDQTLTLSGLGVGDAIRVDSANDASANETVQATSIKRLLQ